MFYRRNKMAASDLEDIWQEIEDAFKRPFFSPQLNWIQHSTQNTAYYKLQTMTLNILNYEGINFTQKFEGLNLTSANYFENLRRVKLLLTLRQTTEIFDDEYFTSAYLLESNTINVPVAFLQRYYFWADAYPKALMFGTMGYIMGHELVHGFSSNGRNYHNGEANSWWDPLSNKNYLEREVCFKEQYGLHPDTQTTDQTENIADNGGLSIALAAYKEWFERQRKMDTTRRLLDNERLPSLNFSAKQLFYLSFAQKYCEDIDYYALAEPSTPDLHASGPIRVIGSLSNLDDVSHEFSCPVGSPMKPEGKCKIY